MGNSVLLRQVELFISFLKRLDESDIYGLENGTMKICFEKRPVVDANNIFDEFTYGQYLREVESMRSREECWAYFQKAKLKKKDLEGILQYLGVSFTKKDTKERLQSKIIENTIGTKLLSDAIINK